MKLNDFNRYAEDFEEKTGTGNLMTMVSEYQVVGSTGVMSSAIEPSDSTLPHPGVPSYF